MKPYVASYDRAADVLYIVQHPPVASEGVGLEDGLVAEYDLSDGSACGLTVVGFDKYGWAESLPRLVGIVQDRLPIEAGPLADLVRAAVSPDADGACVSLDERGFIEPEDCLPAAAIHAAVGE